MRAFIRGSIVTVCTILVVVGVALATTYTGDWFVSQTDDFPSCDVNNAQFMKHNIHMTSGTDYIRMNDGSDYVYMAGGDDEINMGPGTDKIEFYGQSTTTETINFDSADTTYIKYTGADDNLEVRSNSGDVIITLGN